MAQRRRRVLFILSSSACCSIEEVVGGQGVALQLYMIRDRPFMQDLLERTTALGVETLILDGGPHHPQPRCYRDVRSSLIGNQGLARAHAELWRSCATRAGRGMSA